MELMPRAEWTQDCQGKQDFDGPIISVSTRYYPGPGVGGSLVLEAGSSEFKTIPYGPQPSANSSILLRLGPKHKGDGGGDYYVWKTQDFTAPTESKTKALVEAWVTERMAEIVACMGGIGQFKAP
jgi:hypothetical protein